VKELPPENWDDALVTQWFDTPLTYRRTIVFIKDATDSDGKPIKPFFVIRDQYEGPELDVTYNLHALGTDAKVDGQRIAFDKLNAVVIKPAEIEPEMFKWAHDNGGLEQTISPRITRHGESVEFITVLLPAHHTPVVAQHPGGVKVGNTIIQFGTGLPDNSMPPIGKTGSAVEVWSDETHALSLKQDEIDLNRSQGDIGLFVPDVGYPFGPIPRWLIDQRGEAVTAQGVLP